MDGENEDGRREEEKKTTGEEVRNRRTREDEKEVKMKGTTMSVLTFCVCVRVFVSKCVSVFHVCVCVYRCSRP